MAGTKEIISELGKNTRFKSGEQAVESGRKGGRASQKKLKEKRLIKDVLEERLAARGMTLESMCDTLIDKAIQYGGRDFEIVRDTLGQKPTDKVEVKALTIEDILNDKNGASF